MIHPCDKPCDNKTASGYCATTACINPKYSNIGTAHYGQGVQKRIVTHGDELRAMTDEELAEFLLNRDLDVVEKESKAAGFTYKVDREQCLVNVIDWLKEEAITDV